MLTYCCNNINKQLLFLSALVSLLNVINMINQSVSLISLLNCRRLQKPCMRLRTGEPAHTLIHRTPKLSKKIDEKTLDAFFSKRDFEEER
jgi:hypothetical protein